MPPQLEEDARSYGMQLQVFAYKDSIASEIEAADLVISHAGTEK